MATTYVGKSAPIRGPYLKHAFAKYVLKGEDAWLQQRDVDNTVSASRGMPMLSACYKADLTDCWDHFYAWMAWTGLHDPSPFTFTVIRALFFYLSYKLRTGRYRHSVW